MKRHALADKVQLRQHILDQIINSEEKQSRSGVTQVLSKKLGISRNDIGHTINKLILEKELEYTYVFGNSYLEKSFNRPVRISSSVVVKPFNLEFAAVETDIVIDMIPGISFGSGDHPTTRLCVCAIEDVLKDRRLIPDFQGSAMLDIGTGSGILAIAAVKFGIEKGIGLDTDPCAISEAKNNVQINGLANRIKILHPDRQPDTTYSFIAANLRYPDIMKLCPLIEQKTRPGAPVVFSGLRPEETDAVVERYTSKSFKCLSGTGKMNWASLIFRKP